jgi:hypothetical protein
MHVDLTASLILYAALQREKSRAQHSASRDISVTPKNCCVWGLNRKRPIDRKASTLTGAGSGRGLSRLPWFATVVAFVHKNMSEMGFFAGLWRIVDPPLVGAKWPTGDGQPIGSAAVPRGVRAVRNWRWVETLHNTAEIANLARAK